MELFARTILMKADPQCQPAIADELSLIWDEVVKRIIDQMMDLTSDQMTELHIDLREEMTFELVRLQNLLTNKVVIARVGDRSASQIDVMVEREECLGPAGESTISETAKDIADGVWLKLYRERWQPKTVAALRREKDPPNQELSIKPVQDNHFIPKWFIKQHWSSGGMIQRFRNDDYGKYSSRLLTFGQWGYRKNLYSDRLEAYFQLIDGDAVEPIRKVLNVEPLNRPQREALVGFLIILKLRNPAFIEQSALNMKPIVQHHVGQSESLDPNYLRAVYETLYGNNELYSKIAGPLLGNTWAIVEAPEPSFVLPDSAGILSSVSQGQIGCFPLTSTKCFVCLPPLEEKKRVVAFPYSSG